jgi:putative hydrolase of HD superfamily
LLYFLAKFEENHQQFDWIEIIEGGIFELLQRIVLTDLKPPIIYKIKEDPIRYQQLNQWVANELQPVLSDLGNPFFERFTRYFEASEDNINRKILNAAHFMLQNLSSI